MKKSDLIKIVSKDTKISKKNATKAVNSVFISITRSLKKGEKVTLIGFGTFDVAKKKGRTGRNPSTGEKIKVKACNVPRFRAGKSLKSAANKQTDGGGTGPRIKKK